MNICFMGTPDFSLKCLEEIYNNHNLLCVFTQPDKPKGRKMIMTPSPVKEFAVAHSVPVYQPKSLRNSDSLDIIKKYNPDVIVVVAYGQILPKEILDYPKYGCINIHASLLPKLRGASPIQWSIVSGEDRTGVTSMQMNEGLDTGDILIKKDISIDDDDTADTLHDKLAVIGAEVLNETLDNIDNITPVKQGESFSYAPIITKEMAQIDFKSTAKEIICKVRGFNSWPVAFFYYNNKRIKVYSASISDLKGNPGEILVNNKKVIIACGDLAIELDDVQLEGKKRMKINDLLNGYKFDLGDIIQYK